MIQTHSLLLWAGPRAETTEEAANRILQVCDVLASFDRQLTPAYEQAERKRDVRSFQPSPERIRELIECGRNREGKRIFDDLGSTVGLFTNLEDTQSAAISFTVRSTHPRFSNSLVIDFPTSAPILSGDHPFTQARMMLLFKSLITVWQPYWGAVVNDQNKLKYDVEFLTSTPDGLPTLVHWINFLSSEMVHRCNLDAVRNHGGDTVSIDAVLNGVLLTLQPYPIDSTNPLHQERQLKATAALCGVSPTLASLN